MNIAIVEDNVEQMRLMKDFLAKFSEQRNAEYSLSCFESCESFFEDKTRHFDIIFLDIDFGKEKMNGMDAAKRLRSERNDAIIIFVTSLSQFAIDGYQVDALDFVVKPVDYGTFAMKMEKALRKYVSQSGCHDVLIGVEGGSSIFLKDVLYIEVVNHDVFYHTSDKEYRVRTTMRKVEESLKDMPFSRCNVCYLVNLAHVQIVNKDSVVLDNGKTLSMPKTRRKEFLADLGRFISGGMGR